MTNQAGFDTSLTITDPLICTANVAVPPQESITELVGGIVITCTGGLPRQDDRGITVSLPAALVSRLLEQCDAYGSTAFAFVSDNGACNLAVGLSLKETPASPTGNKEVKQEETATKAAITK